MTIKGAAKKKDQGGATMDKPIKVRLPGFISEKDVGLGDAIKHATMAIGIQPCAGCIRRAETLNQWVIFTGWH